MRLGGARKYTGVEPSVAVGGAGPLEGEGGWVGRVGGARLSRGAPGTLTVYCSQARCPLRRL